MFTENANRIFNRAIDDYHRFDDVDHPVENPFDEGSLDHLLLYEELGGYGAVASGGYHPRSADRSPSRRWRSSAASTSSNQVRTDMVEYIDSYLLDKYKAVVRSPTRVSIPKRRVGDRPAVDSGAENLPHASGDAAQRRGRGAPRRLPQKLDVLLSQQVDLSRAIEELIEDIEAGRKYMKTYKQMKMYNDPALNPVLYGAKK